MLHCGEIAVSYAKLNAELLPKYLDTSAYRVANGGVEETTRLLELLWDHSVFLAVLLNIHLIFHHRSLSREVQE
jgi:hypothetical protein